MILGADQKERGLLRDENVHARAHVRALMTRKSCAVEMRNAILWNYLKMLFNNDVGVSNHFPLVRAGKFLKS